MAKKRKPQRPRVMLSPKQKEFGEKVAEDFIRKLIQQKGKEYEYKIKLDDRRLICAIVFMVLHDKFGFGKKRLKVFDDEITKVMENIKDGYLKPADIYDWFSDEMNIKFELSESAAPETSLIR